MTTRRWWSGPGGHTSRARRWGFVLAVLAAVACGGHVPVHTASAPDTHRPRLRNFMVLQPQGLGAAAASHDAMVDNLATFRQLSFQLLLAFQARGYLADTAAPDFAVAYYAAQHLPVDTLVFNYGYPFYGSYPWWQDEAAAAHPTRPDEGVVIVDVVTPKTKTLLWRGEAVVRLPATQPAYLDALTSAVDAIVNDFVPGAATGPTAARPQRDRRMR